MKMQFINLFQKQGRMVGHLGPILGDPGRPTEACVNEYQLQFSSLVIFRGGDLVDELNSAVI